MRAIINTVLDARPNHSELTRTLAARIAIAREDYPGAVNHVEHALRQPAEPRLELQRAAGAHRCSRRA
jgi:uncharacterized protein HemY